jgi:starch synthase
MIDIPGLFDREKIYSYRDDTERFVTFQTATVNWLCSWEKKIDLVHCHDQHTGFIPFMLARVWEYRNFAFTPTVFTIHNGEYQGQFSKEKTNYLPPFHSFFHGLVEWNDAINPMASAIKNAWRITTVSPSYMEEIRLTMSGLESLMVSESWKCKGILNGIDSEVWNPATDPLLETNYSVKNVDKGKLANKERLCSTFDLDPDKPLFAFIGRLAREKGADILPDFAFKAMIHNPGGQNILILGSGEEALENSLTSLNRSFKGNYASYIGYNEKLAHEIYAGADFLLMPSKVEPCGLNQMYALRYGTIPIVRRTGGLKDTVIDMGEGGFGFCHDNVSSDELLHALHRATSFYQDKKLLSEIRKKIMKIDHSWEKSAKEYIELYKTIK